MSKAGNILSYFWSNHPIRNYQVFRTLTVAKLVPCEKVSCPASFSRTYLPIQLLIEGPSRPGFTCLPFVESICGNNWWSPSGCWSQSQSRVANDWWQVAWGRRQGAWNGNKSINCSKGMLLATPSSEAKWKGRGGDEKYFYLPFIPAALFVVRFGVGFFFLRLFVFFFGGTN